MPRKFRKRKRFYRKKRKFRKAKMSMRLPNSARTYTQLIEGWIPMNNGGVIADFAVSISINSPTYCVVSGGTWGQLPNVCTNWARAVAMFDEYKVKTCEVTFEPNQINTNFLSAEEPFSMYMVNDKDDIALAVSDVRVMNDGMKPIKFYNGRSVKRKARPTLKQYYNTNTVALNPAAAPAANNQMLTATYYESIKVYAPRLAVNYFAGRIYCRWLVQFRAIVF